MIFDGGQADHLDVQGNSVSIRIDSTGSKFFSKLIFLVQLTYS